MVSSINRSRCYDARQLSNIKIILPKNFSDGFLLDYSQSTNGMELKKGNLFSLPKVVVTVEHTLYPNEVFIVDIPFIANKPGDYSGLYSFAASIDINNNRFGRIKYSEEQNIIVRP